jgi:uncharacterized protein (TIGR00369 family)
MSLTESVAEFMRNEFPQSKVIVEEVGHRTAKVRQPIGEEHLRPGGTVSGPVLMAVADVAMYAAILGEVGLIALAVTTNLSINFLSKPSAACAIIGDCKLMKVGKRLVVGEVTLYSEGSPEPVAHAVGTYSIPPLS